MNHALVMGTAWADARIPICIVMKITSAQIILWKELDKVDHVLEMVTVTRDCNV